MELSFTIEERAPQPARVEHGIRRMAVTKVQRSAEGFKTTTGTTLTCRDCRGEDYRDAGVEPFPIATWLLTGEGHQLSVQPIDIVHRIPMKRVEILPLCSDHFKALRERNKRDQGTDISGFTGSNVSLSGWFDSSIDGPSEPWDNTPGRA